MVIKTVSCQPSALSRMALAAETVPILPDVYRNLALRLELQQISSLSDIDRGGIPHPDLLSFGFMNVTAEKIIRLARFNEVLDRHASRMQPFADPIEVYAG